MSSVAGSDGLSVKGDATIWAIAKRSILLRRVYRTLLAAGCAEYSVRIPECYQKHFINLGGSFEVGHIISNLVGAPAKVLLIGVFAGRDYYFLQTHGHDVVGFDLVNQTDIHGKMVVGDVQAVLPFKANSFDAVVMVEVLEHLEEDLGALRNLRNVLSDGGVLVIGVPYYQDQPEHHLRIYSPQTLRRLLGAAGFRIDRIVERPGLLTYGKWFFALNHLAQLVSFLVTRRVFYRPLLTGLSKCEEWLGTKPIPLRKWSSGYGVFVKCSKGHTVDTRALNRRDFGSDRVRGSADIEQREARERP